MASPALLYWTPARYVPRDPTKTVLYGLVAEQRATYAKVTRDEGGAP